MEYVVVRIAQAAHMDTVFSIEMTHTCVILGNKSTTENMVASAFPDYWR